MAINVLGALNTEINTIWKFGIKNFWMFFAAFVPEIKHINNHFGIWRPRHKSEFSICTKSGSDGTRINAARFAVTQSI